MSGQGSKEEITKTIFFYKNAEKDGGISYTLKVGSCPTVKILKFGTPQTIAIIVPKIEKV